MGKAKKYPRMKSKSICRTTIIIFCVFHSCSSIGIQRAAYEPKYGRVIHEETVGCGSQHEVGPQEFFYFNGKLIRSPFESSNAKDIHYLDFSNLRNKINSVAAAEDAIGPQNLPVKPPGEHLDSVPEPSNFQPEEEETRDDSPTLSPEERMAVAFDRPLKSPGGALQQNQPRLSADTLRKLRGNSKPRNEFPQNYKRTGLGRQIPVPIEVTTTKPPMPSRKPHWSDRYFGQAPKEARATNPYLREFEVQPRIPPQLNRKERFINSVSSRSQAGKKISKRSIFSRRRDNEMRRGKHEMCVWRFTAKPSCKHLVARLTRFKPKDMLCENEHLRFQTPGRELRFCNSKPFSGVFESSGKVLIVEHVKLLGAAESNFEGYVTCIDK